jgi:hypothetical protein
MYTLEGKAERTWGVLGPGTMKVLPRERITPSYGYTVQPLSTDREVLSIPAWNTHPIIAPAGTFETILARFFDYEEEDLLGL